MRPRLHVVPLVCAAVGLLVAGLTGGPGAAQAAGPASEIAYIKGDTAEIKVASQSRCK